MTIWAGDQPPLGPTGTPVPHQFRTIDDVARLLRRDFAANGINATVEANEWQPEWFQGEPRVVVGYGRFTFGTPEGSDQPGASIEIPDGTGDVARAVLDDLTRFRVWCHDPGSGTGAPVAESARRGTKELLLQTMRAIREALAAPFREPPMGEWPKPSEATPGYQSFVYGSFVSLEVLIPSPVLGTRLHVRTIREIEFSDSVNIDGTVTASGGGSEDMT